MCGCLKSAALLQFRWIGRNLRLHKQIVLARYEPVRYAHLDILPAECLPIAHKFIENAYFGSRLFACRMQILAMKQTNICR